MQLTFHQLFFRLAEEFRGVGHILMDKRLDFLQLFVEVLKAHHRKDRVRRHHDGQHNGQNDHGNIRQQIGHPDNERMNHLNHQHRHGAEHHQPRQADAAVEIKFPPAVIPPFRVKQLFHCPAGKVLHRSGDQHTGEKNQHRVVNPAKQQQIQHRAGAINRTVRPVEETAVDQFTAGNGA